MGTKMNGEVIFNKCYCGDGSKKIAITNWGANGYRQAGC